MSKTNKRRFDIVAMLLWLIEYLKVALNLF